MNEGLDSGLIDVVGRAIWHTEGSPTPWRDLPSDDRAYFEDQARAALESAEVPALIAALRESEAARERQAAVIARVEAEMSRWNPHGHESSRHEEARLLWMDIRAALASDPATHDESEG